MSEPRNLGDPERTPTLALGILFLAAVLASLGYAALCESGWVRDARRDAGRAEPVPYCVDYRWTTGDDVFAPCAQLPYVQDEDVVGSPEALIDT